MERLFEGCQSDCFKAKVTNLLDKLYDYDFTIQGNLDNTDEAKGLDDTSDIEKGSNGSEDRCQSTSDVTDSNSDSVHETIDLVLLKDRQCGTALFGDDYFDGDDVTQSTVDNVDRDGEDPGYGLDEKDDNDVEEEIQFSSVHSTSIFVPEDVQADEEFDEKDDNYAEEEEIQSSSVHSTSIFVPEDVQADEELNIPAATALNNASKPGKALFSRDNREARIDQICSFFDLKGNQIVADAFLKLKECLVLEGNFVYLEIVQVIIT